MRPFKIILTVFMVWFGLAFTCYAYDIVRVTNTPEADERGYSVAIFGNTVYAVWRAGSEIYFDKSMDSGKTWGQYRKVIARADLAHKILIDKC